MRKNETGDDYAILYKYPVEDNKWEWSAQLS